MWGKMDDLPVLIQATDAVTKEVVKHQVILPLTCQSV